MVEEKKKILLTGASSQVGSAIRPFLRNHFHVRLQYLSSPIEPVYEGEEVVKADICDLESVLNIVKDVSAIIHLAGQARSLASWEQVKSPNIDGTYNVFEAARSEGIPKVIFASTNRTMGMYDLEEKWPISVTQSVRPDSLYAVTKVFGEALASYYVDHFPISIICLRIGWVLEKPFNEKSLRQWLSPRDCEQLIWKSLETEIKFGVYFGASNNTRLKWDLSNAKEELGFNPKDDSEVFVSEIFKSK